MPDVAAEMINGGHDFKTSHMADFERKPHEIQKSDL